MNMHRPGILPEITPVIFEDAPLHNSHGDEHPEMESFIL
jgi:hypothetical protein